MRAAILGLVLVSVAGSAAAITPERVFDSSLEATPVAKDCGPDALTPSQFAALADPETNSDTGFCIPPVELDQPVNAVVCAGSNFGCTGCLIETDRTTATLTSAPDGESIGIVDSLTGDVALQIANGGSCSFVFTATGLGLAVYDAERLGLDGKRLGPRSDIDGAVVDFQSGSFCSTTAYAALFRDLLDDAYIAHLVASTPAGGDVCPAN